MWGQPDDSAFAPHGDWIAVSFMTLKGITNGRTERALNSIRITGPFSRSRTRIWNSHAGSSFRILQAFESAITVEALKA
jgi:hypothetical protein